MASARLHRPEENKQSELIKYESILCYVNAYFSPQMFSESSCSVLFSCKMRKFVTWQPCWDQVEMAWRNAKYRSHDRRTANRNALSLWNDLGLIKLDFLKPENRAMRRCRSLVIFQNTWITICWKVIMEFLPNDAKNILPTATLSIKSGEPCREEVAVGGPKYTGLSTRRPVFVSHVKPQSWFICHITSILKVAVGNIFLASLGKNVIITFQHIVIQMFWEITRLLHLIMTVFSGFKRSSPWRETLTNHRSFNWESVTIGCAPVMWPDVGVPSTDFTMVAASQTFSFYS